MEERTKLSFCDESTHNVQKEHLFEKLLLSHLIANDFNIAKPAFDLGDDLWFGKRNESRIQRAQIKSAHCCLVRNKCKNRIYDITLQIGSLRKREPDYIYILAMADERFHGLSTGTTSPFQNELTLCVDVAKWVEAPTGHLAETHSPKTNKSTKVVTMEHVYRMPARGFHFGYVSADVLKFHTQKWNKNGTLKVEVSCVAPRHFQYHIQKHNVTQYFGQVDMQIAATTGGWG